jgi:hypothetical protein
MNEDDIADSLTVEIEKENPDWDFAAKVITCKNSLARNIVSLSEARIAFGEAVFTQALEQIKKLKTEDLTAIEGSAAEHAQPSRRRQPIWDNTPYPDWHAGRRKFAIAASFFISIVGAAYAGTKLDNWNQIEVNSESVSKSDGKPLVFSVPEESVEKELKAQVDNFKSRSDTLSPQDAELAIKILRKHVQESIIALEARKRALSDNRISGQKTSDGSDAIRPSHPVSGVSSVLVSNP